MIPLLCLSALLVKYDAKLKLVKTNNVYAIILTIWATIGQVLYWIVSYVYITTFNGLLLKKSDVAEMVHVMFVISIETVLVLAFLNAVLKRKQHVEFLNKLLKIEKQARKFGSLTYHASMRRNSLWILSSSMAFYSTIYLVKLFAIFPDKPENSLFSLYYMTVALFIILNILFLLVIVQTQKHIFVILNSNLTRILKGFNVTEKDELKGTLDLHNELKHTINGFSDAFGILCFAFMLYISGEQTSKIFNGPLASLNFNYFSDSNIEAEVVRRILINAYINVIMISPMILLFYRLGAECEKVHIESEKIYYVCDCLETLPSVKDQQIRSEIIKSIFVRCLQKQKSFTAYGFYQINKSVIFSVNLLTLFKNI